MEEPSIMRERTRGNTALCCNLTSTMELQHCDVTTKRIRTPSFSSVTQFLTDVQQYVAIPLLQRLVEIAIFIFGHIQTCI